ncbi:MAG: hypothetical protein LUC97_08345 [Clostridiales bacterium]|nr:hypothetical protein [Clostridiales bacterium]MCD8215631.1 hypothetical protein [Clostridiales bacterium]
MKIFKSRENIIFALLLLLLVILAVIQININGDKETEVFSALEEESPVYEDGLAEIIEIPSGEEEQPNIYDLSGYIFKNSGSYMERLKTEVNNMANATSDNDHLYDVAESIRLNQISYYTMLSGRYEDDDTELIEACKSYVFNVEALAANIMEFINESRTKYISRAMLCIANDTALSNNFTSAAAAYKAAHTEEETAAETSQ